VDWFVDRCICEGMRLWGGRVVSLSLSVCAGMNVYLFNGIENWNDLFIRFSITDVCASLDGYCSTVQGLLDWFEVDLGFTKLLFIRFLITDFSLSIHISIHHSIHISIHRAPTHCNTLQHTATHCNTLQLTATHCNTLQHTATHYNTLHHTA